MQSLEQVGASALRGCDVSVPSTRWDEVGGAELAKLALKRAVEWVCGLMSVSYDVCQSLCSICVSYPLTFCLGLATIHKQPILKADAFKRFGLTPPRGILLYGPPGCAYLI